MPKEHIPEKLKIWMEARKRFHLSHAQVQMARELGLNPKKFGKLANHRQEPWKAPLPQFIEHFNWKRFRRQRPAEAMCCGMVAGLRRAEEAKPEGALGWAPDFPAEEADDVVEDLLRACPTKERKSTRDRLLDALAQDVPDWSEMLEQVANRAMSRK